MPMSVHIASGGRRDATAASATGAKPDANTCHIRSATCRPPEMPDHERVIDPEPVHVAMIARVAYNVFSLRREQTGGGRTRRSVIVDWAAGQFRPVPRVSLRGGRLDILGIWTGACSAVPARVT
jgi:hypothetical protein